MKTRVTVKNFAVAEKMFSSFGEGGTNEKFINPQCLLSLKQMQKSISECHPPMLFTAA